MKILSTDRLLHAGVSTTSHMVVKKNHIWVGITTSCDNDLNSQSFSTIEGTLNDSSPFIVSVDRGTLSAGRGKHEAGAINGLQVMALAKLISGEGTYTYDQTIRTLEKKAMSIRPSSMSPVGDSTISEYLVATISLYSAFHILGAISRDDRRLSYLTRIAEHLSLQAFSINQDSSREDRKTIAKSTHLLSTIYR